MTPEAAKKFEDKWSDDSPDYPKCASCGEQIGSAEAEEQADETYEPEIPLRIWRNHPTKRGEKQELTFHVACGHREGIL